MMPTPLGFPSWAGLLALGRPCSFCVVCGWSLGRRLLALGRPRLFCVARGWSLGRRLLRWAADRARACWRATLPELPPRLGRGCMNFRLDRPVAMPWATA